MERPKVLLIKLNKALILINILFIIFYVILLDRYPALWYDESYFSNGAYNLVNGNGLILTTFPGLWDYTVFNFDKGPIYYLLLALIYKIFGTGLIQGRVLSVIFAIIGLNIFYLLAKEFVSKKKSLLLTIIFGTMPIYFIAAREIRMEIVYSVFDLLAFYFIVRYYKTDKKYNRYIIYASIFSSLSLFTHPNGLINIIAIITCLVFFNIKLTFKDIFSKNLLHSIKENLKIILLYAIIIGLVAFPYVIFILLNYNVYVAQAGNNSLFSFTAISSNIHDEYEQFKGFFFSFVGTSLPTLIWVVIVLIAIGIIALSVITLFIRSYDDPYIKITFLYVFISVVLFTFFIDHKKAYYMTTFLPQLVIGLGLFIERGPSRFPGLSGWYRQLLIFIDRIKSIFQKRIIKKVSIPLIIGIALIGINTYSCELNSYENRNCDSNLIRSELLAVGINSTDILVGDLKFWIPMHDFNFVAYDTFIDRMYFENQTFNSILTEIKPTIILFDKNWRNGEFPYAASLNATFLASVRNYLQYNCTRLTTINITSDGTTQWQSFFPIEVYATNFR